MLAAIVSPALTAYTLGSTPRERKHNPFSPVTHSMFAWVQRLLYTVPSIDCISRYVFLSGLLLVLGSVLLWSLFTFYLL